MPPAPNPTLSPQTTTAHARQVTTVPTALTQTWQPAWQAATSLFSTTTTPLTAFLMILSLVITLVASFVPVDIIVLVLVRLLLLIYAEWATSVLILLLRHSLLQHTVKLNSIVLRDLSRLTLAL